MSKTKLLKSNFIPTSPINNKKWLIKGQYAFELT